MTPLVNELPISPARIEKAKIISAATSIGPIFSARMASGAETVIKTMSLKVSPVIEENSAILVAFSGLPCFASG